MGDRTVCVSYRIGFITSNMDKWFVTSSKRQTDLVIALFDAVADQFNFESGFSEY